MIKRLLVYVGVTVFVAVFGAIYEAFSFGVYSYFMIYAYAFCLLGGVMPTAILLWRGRVDYKPMSYIAVQIYRSGLAIFTVGFLVRGALDIYGTTNRLTNIYWIGGSLFLLVGALLFGLSLLQKKKVKKKVLPRCTDLQKSDLSLMTGGQYFLMTSRSNTCPTITAPIPYGKIIARVV
ncbi:MAG: hypothetical protein K5929_00060 [Lachnospiraceae bacterium]|nr:hypothetical protein [Lachnospiraceae bacterium]